MKYFQSQKPRLFPQNSPFVRQYECCCMCTIDMLTLQTTRSTPRAQTSASHSLRSVEQSSHEWNSLANYFVVSCLTHPEKFMKIRLSVLSVILLACMDTKKTPRKIDHESKGLNATSPQCSRLIPVWYPTYPENVIKIRSPVFLQCC